VGYFDGLTSTSFKKTEEGKTVFFPNGKLGSGYLISEEQEFKIRRFIKGYYMISLPLTVIAVIIFKIYALFLLVIEMPLYYITIKKMLRNTEKSKEKLTMKDTVGNMGKSMGLAVSILMFILSLLMTGLGVLCITLPETKIIGIIGTLFFGLGLVESIFLIRAAIKNKKNNLKIK